MATFINVVGTYYHPDTVEIGVGDFIILCPEPTNKYDSDAVAVYNTTNEKIGYVSNSVKTLAEGCIPASELKWDMRGIITATIRFKKDNTMIAEVEFR